jgi:hypothetical protein
MAQSQMAEPPGVRHRRLVGSGRLTAASRGAPARLLHRRRQAHLRWACGHWDARQGSCGSAAATGPDRLQDIASERTPVSEDSVRIVVLSRVHWVEPKIVAEITYLTWTADNLLRHTVYIGLRRTSQPTKCGEKWREVKARTQVRLTQGSIAKDAGNTAEQETAGVDVKRTFPAAAAVASVGQIPAPTKGCSEMAGLDV